MKRNIVLITLALMVLALCSTASFAQMTGTIKGKVTDQTGKPMVGATVIYQSVDSGRKYTLKTDKGGSYFSMGVQAGTYNIQLLQDNQMIYHVDNVPVKIANENNFDLNLAKEAAAQGQRPLSEEDKKKAEAIKQANEKIKGLNAKLAQAEEASKAGNCEQAATLLQEVAAVDQTHDIIFGRLGEYLMCAKKYPEAVESYKKAVALSPTRGEYHNNLGQAYLKAGQVDAAIAEYNTAAQNDPTNAGTYFFNLGAVLTNTGKVDQAIEAFDKALAADPNKADAYYWKGVNMLGKATVDKSGKMIAPPGTAEALNKYLELQPQGANAEGAKGLLASIGAPVQTSFGERKAQKKK
jgi:tetratricopeptide (TPR) repeat protein